MQRLFYKFALYAFIVSGIFTSVLNAEELKKNSPGFEVSIIDFGWFFNVGDEKIDYNSMGNLDMKLYYDFFVVKYFSIGAEVGFFYSINNGQDSYSQVYSTRIDGRLKGVFPFYDGKIEMFLLFRGGLSAGDVQYRGKQVGYNIFGAMGVDFGVGKALRIGVMNDVGFEDFPDLNILHFIRLLVFIEYRI